MVKGARSRFSLAALFSLWFAETMQSGDALAEPAVVHGVVIGHLQAGVTGDTLTTEDGVIIAKPTHVKKPKTAAPGTISNRGFEQVDPAAPAKALDWIDFWLSGYARVVLGGTAAADPNNPAALRVILTGQTGGGGGQYIELNQTQVAPVFIGGRIKGSNLLAKPDNQGWYWGAHVIAEFFGLTGNDYIYCSTTPITGTFDWMWTGFTSTNCGVNFPIVGVWIEPVVELATGTAWFDLMQINMAMANPPQIGTVTFQFDDGDITGNTAENILTTYGFVGSQAIVSDWVDTNSALTSADLGRIQGKGWDILSHTKSHPYMTQLTDSDAKTQLSVSKSNLQLKNLAVDSVAWPYGNYNQRIVGFAQATPYISARGVFPGDNSALTFPFDVRVRSLTSSTTLDEVRAWLQQAADTKLWVILNMHVIATTSGDIYYNTPEFLDQMAAMVKTEFVNTGKLQVVNYRQGLQKFAVTRQ